MTLVSLLAAPATSPSAAIAALAGAALALVLISGARERRAAALVARAGHEIRGPLCAALLGLETLATAGDHALRVAAVQLELRRAALALEDLATAHGRARERRRAARVGGGGPVDVGALLTGARPAWEALVIAHGARLAVDAAPGLAVRGEPLRLVQACANLVANAAEHGGGTVRVRARALGTAVRIEVTDDGPGLPARVDALVARGRRGARRRGHGLAVAAAVAARHGGRLAAAPATRGARLVLELPAAGTARRELVP